jgi:ketosteroid isomerase-like protein
MSEAHKALVQRLFEVWNTGVLDKIDDLYAEDYVADYRPYAALHRGRQGIRDMVRRAHATFPDYHEELEEIITEGDRSSSASPSPVHSSDRGGRYRQPRRRSGTRRYLSFASAMARSSGSAESPTPLLPCASSA